MILIDTTIDDLKRKIGILYIVTNLLNGHSYIGQSRRTFQKRYRKVNKWWDWCHNDLLRNHINAYGEQNFSLKILFFDKSSEELDDLEISYIAKLNSLYPNGYNFQLGGLKKGTNEEGIEYIRKERKYKVFNLKNYETGEVCQFSNLLKFSRDNRLSESLVRNVLLGKRIRCGKYVLPETDSNIVYRAKNKDGFYLLKDEKGNIHKIYSIKKFCEKNNLCTASICRIINDERVGKVYKGWRLPSTPDGFYPEKANFSRKWTEIILEKDGNIHIVKNAKFFMRTNGISELEFKHMVHGLRGKKIPCKGFVFKEIKMKETNKL
jgi:group I intron endonuclease